MVVWGFRLLMTHLWVTQKSDEWSAREYRLSCARSMITFLKYWLYDDI
jgi:hypothetical protein